MRSRLGKEKDRYNRLTYFGGARGKLFGIYIYLFIWVFRNFQIISTKEWNFWCFVELLLKSSRKNVLFLNWSWNILRFSSIFCFSPYFFTILKHSCYFVSFFPSLSLLFTGTASRSSSRRMTGYLRCWNMAICTVQRVWIVTTISLLTRAT